MSCMNDCGCDQDEDFVAIDRPAPDFDLPAYDPMTDDETTIQLSDLTGRWRVLFFYPADFTFVCPTELRDLTLVRPEMEKLGVEVITASTDTVYTHRAWVLSESLLKGFPYKMVADHTGETSYRYRVLDSDSGMAARGTFVIDPEGIVRVIDITSGPLGRDSGELLRRIEALQYMAAHPGTACPARWQAGAQVLRPSMKISGDIASQLDH